MKKWQHVPLQSMVDTTLAEQSKEVWQDRALIWGEDCYYVPDVNSTKKKVEYYKYFTFFYFRMCILLFGICKFFKECTMFLFP